MDNNPWTLGRGSILFETSEMRPWMPEKPTFQPKNLRLTTLETTHLDGYVL